MNLICFIHERLRRIELRSDAWKAPTLPLSYSRVTGRAETSRPQASSDHSLRLISTQFLVVLSPGGSHWTRTSDPPGFNRVLLPTELENRKFMRGKPMSPFSSCGDHPQNEQEEHWWSLPSPWSLSVSNRSPLACHANALPTELRPLVLLYLYRCAYRTLTTLDVARGFAVVPAVPVAAGYADRPVPVPDQLTVHISPLKRRHRAVALVPPLGFEPRTRRLKVGRSAR